jgi:putative hydroxymethylpyrimidine transport system substrate-binding protein
VRVTRLACALLAALLLWPVPHARAADKLRVVLDWFVNPDHGPLVIAREKGYFRDAGLDVDLIAPADPNDPPKLVAAKQAEIAVSYEPQLHLQVDQGLPVTRIGTLIGTPLTCLLSLGDGPVQTLKDLKGRKVGFSVAGTEEALLGTMLATVGLKLEDVQLIDVNFNLVPSLMSGQVDAVMGAFRNVEAIQVGLMGRPAHPFFPEENGVPPFDELIYIADHDNLGDPRLKGFLQAVERATLWIENHPGEAWDTFKNTDAQLDSDLNRRSWLATLPRWSPSPAALDNGRYARFAAFLKDKGLIKSTPPVASYAVDLFAQGSKG